MKENECVTAVSICSQLITFPDTYILYSVITEQWDDLVYSVGQLDS